MLQNLIDWFKNLTARHFVNFGLAGAALGIAAAVWVSNGASGLALDCPVNLEAQAALDAEAVGTLAALQATGTGRNYSDLGFIDDTGRPMTIADFSGKALLVNFWATWCAPCREEMPALDRLAVQMGGDSFAVVTINLDTGADGVIKAQAFLDEESLANLPLLADPSFAAFDRLKAEAVAIGLPATLLLDGRGCELAVLQGPAAWDSEQGKSVIQTLVAYAGV